MVDFHLLFEVEQLYNAPLDKYFILCDDGAGMISSYLQVLLSSPCVLVTPKRKVAGHLAVMKKVLHFFGEFLVEGTGGSSVLSNFDAASASMPMKPEQLEGVNKQKVSKWPIKLDMGREKSETFDSPVIDHDQLLPKEPKTKRHRRWSVSKV